MQIGWRGFQALSDFAISFNIYESTLLSCSFSNLNLNTLRIEKSAIRDCLFSNCDLRESSFLHSRFEGGQILNCDVRGSNFIGSSGFHINPNENRLMGAKFDHVMR